jgi:hypothetical protein
MVVINFSPDEEILSRTRKNPIPGSSASPPESYAHPPDSSTPPGLRSETLDVFNIIASPCEVYEHVRRSPEWRMPAVFALVSSLVFGWLMVPALVAQMKNIFMSSFGNMAGDRAADGVRGAVTIFQLVVRPMAICARWLLLSALLAGALSAFDKRPGRVFRQITCLVAYAHTIPVLMEFLNLLVLHLRGIEKIVGKDDLMVFRGLDLLIGAQAAHPAIGPVLASINPFFLWHAAVLAGGFRALAGCRFPAAACIVVICLLILNTLEVVLLGSMV